VEDLGRVRLPARPRTARAPARLYPRILLDIGPADLLRGLAACALPLRAPQIAEDGVICFSVRSGFHLLLDALETAQGDEAVFSAITHPDMARIAEAHGLRVVPVDLDAGTLSPRPELLAAALGPRTRLVVVAHLFGGRVDLRPIAALLQGRNALLVEDCAQSLGPRGLVPDPVADVSMFSFGTIKTSTALGGAVLSVADAGLAARMEERQRSWPRQSRGRYARKLLKILGLTLIGRPRAYALLARVAPDLDRLVNGAVRGFPGPDLLIGIARRPSAPLLRLLSRRLRRFDGGRIARRAEAGEEVLAGLPPGIESPGAAALDRTHWVFPVLDDDPDGLVKRLRARGFDAARATSGITALAPAEEAERVMRSVVFLPVYPELPAAERRRLVESLR
jgi:perosamine synthetase